VAQALHDTAELPDERTDPSSIPDFKPPTGLRACCVFGMDLKVKVADITVPGYKIENIRGPNELGPHGYDKGNVKGENNGLVYTCRGGFIDSAHIRDNADRTLYLSMQLARRLPEGITLALPEEGTGRLVVIKPLPPSLLDSSGRWWVATTLAQWINFQLAIWHELTQWYGWERIKGFSDRVSAFSLEDLYSDVFGESLAAGIVLHREANSRRAYDQAMDAWIAEGLRRLGAVSRANGRRAMQAVDGIYWDSRREVPDNKLVLRRFLRITSPLEGWRVVEAVPPGPLHAELVKMCDNQPGPLPLSVPQRIGENDISDLVTVEFEFSDWIPDRFPLPVQKGTILTQRDFPRLLNDIRARGEKELGVGFDEPGPHPDAEEVPRAPAREQRKKRPFTDP
jgi:hypothetical protein